MFRKTNISELPANDELPREVIKYLADIDAAADKMNLAAAAQSDAFDSWLANPTPENTKALAALQKVAMQAGTKFRELSALAKNFSQS